MIPLSQTPHFQQRVSCLALLMSTTKLRLFRRVRFRPYDPVLWPALALALFNVKTFTGFKMKSWEPTCDSPPEGVNYVGGNDLRTTMDIIWVFSFLCLVFKFYRGSEKN